MSSLEELQRMRERLLEEKRRKEEQLLASSGSHAPIAPMASTDELQRKRELLLEQKRLKEQELASITSSDSQKKRSRNINKSEKAARRSKKDSEEGRRGRTRKAAGDPAGAPSTKKSRSNKTESTGPLVVTTPAVGHQVSDATAIYDLKRHFFELKKEHKRDRKLVKEQQIQLNQIDELVHQRLHLLEESLGRLVNHLGLTDKVNQKKDEYKHKNETARKEHKEAEAKKEAEEARAREVAQTSSSASTNVAVQPQVVNVRDYNMATEDGGEGGEGEIEGGEASDIQEHQPVYEQPVYDPQPVYAEQTAEHQPVNGQQQSTVLDVEQMHQEPQQQFLVAPTDSATTEFTSGV